MVERFVSPGEFVDNKPLLKLAQMDPLEGGSRSSGQHAPVYQGGHEGDNCSGDPGGYDLQCHGVDCRPGDRPGQRQPSGSGLNSPNPDYQLPGGLKCQVQFVDLQGHRVTCHGKRGG